jgi:methionyl-tRNA formyltransferase
MPIVDTDTAVTLHDKLAAQGARLIVDALHRLGELKPQAQAAEGVTYAAKIEKAEAQLDFRRPAIELARKIRAFDPFPGATAVTGGTTLKIWSVAPAAASGATVPGTILAAGAEGVVVTCGDGSALALTLLQKPGGKRLSAREFLNSFPLAAGQCFDLPAQP